MLCVCIYLYTSVYMYIYICTYYVYIYIQNTSIYAHNIYHIDIDQSIPRKMIQHDHQPVDGMGFSPC